MTYKIPLVRDTINKQDLGELIEWLKSEPQLTKGPKTLEFEKKWNLWNNTKYSCFVNSGSSANLLAYSVFIESGRLKNKKVIVPAVSWATTVTPAIQLGLEPIMCDCNMDNLGLDIEHLKSLIKLYDPALIVTVNVLGFANDYEELEKLCKENNCFLLEDSCESIGTIYNNKKTGNFGDISTFSFYFGHHMSTIEGGMVCTNNEEFADLIVSLRSHGWDRDLQNDKKQSLRSKYNVTDFKSLYTFYYPGFNFRSTDLQAFIGLIQLNKIDYICNNRNKNFDLYNKLIKKPWNFKNDKHQFVSNFAFPFIHEKIHEIITELNFESIETRPLICGSMGQQPFWTNRYGTTHLTNADIINKNGIYLPNNPSMSEDEISKIVQILNKFL